MTYRVDRRVDAYIDALPDWQQAICREVRDLVHAADRDVTETKGLAAEVRGLGLMIDVELVKDRTTKEPAAKEAAAVRRLAREASVLIGVGGQGGNVVRIQPPLVIEDAALDHALDVVDAALGVVSREA